MRVCGTQDAASVGTGVNFSGPQGFKSTGGEESKWLLDDPTDFRPDIPSRGDSLSPIRDCKPR